MYLTQLGFEGLINLLVVFHVRQSSVEPKLGRNYSCITLGGRGGGGGGGKERINEMRDSARGISFSHV